jgi:hypothetical protein
VFLKNVEKLRYGNNRLLKLCNRLPQCILKNMRILDAAIIDYSVPVIDYNKFLENLGKFQFGNNRLHGIGNRLPLYFLKFKYGFNRLKRVLIDY